MKISYKWIREYIDLHEDAYAFAHALTMSGTEVEEIIHETIPREVVCAQITEVKPHPDADKLSVCMVDDGKENVQVVCGAPNVRQGMMSAFAPVGSNLGEGMKVKKAKLRGVESFGILVSERELSLTDDHAGIMEIDGDVKPGDILLDALDLEDWVLDVNVTPNRGDCLSVIGLARELSALYRKDIVLNRPEIKEDQDKTDSVLSVEVLSPEGCPRYCARVMKDIEIKKSPFYIRRRLHLSGVRAINNIVDITNYVLLEYGQPLHAFDYRLVSEKGIVVRKALDKEKFVTLDSIERSLNSDDLLICDREKPVALAGIMGGENSEVMDTTQCVILESAFFDPVGIRRTSKTLNLTTEASYRFERGIDPAIQDIAADRAAFLMAEYAGAKILKGIIDINSLSYTPKKVVLRKDYLEKVLGIRIIAAQDVEGIFKRLGCRIERTDNGWKVEAPIFRHDLYREIDLVEEFIRVYGMDKITPEIPSFKPMKISDEEIKYHEVRTKLSSMGFTEVVNYSFISPKCNQWFDQDMLELKNPISDDMKLMRTSLIPGLCTVVEKNRNLQVRDLRIFETGKCFFPTRPGELPIERQHVGIAITGQSSETHWSQRPRSVDFYDIKGIAEAIITDARMCPSDQPYLTPGMQAQISVGGKEIGYIGSIHPDILNMHDISEEVFVMEVSAESLFQKQWDGMEHLPKYPSTWRDLSLVVDEAVTYADIVGSIESKGIKELKKIVPVDTYKGDKLPGGKSGITIRITYQSDKRTLEDKMINKWQDSIIKTLQKDFSISLRQ